MAQKLFFLLDVYKTSYYEGGVSSVYLWELEEGFAGSHVNMIG